MKMRKTIWTRKRMRKKNDKKKQLFKRQQRLAYLGFFVFCVFYFILCCFKYMLVYGLGLGLYIELNRNTLESRGSMHLRLFGFMYNVWKQAGVTGWREVRRRFLLRGFDLDQ
ncbi:unnamed protein product [Choristocarpus tenellus]